ncbi:MAG: homoserine dehydrogenase [Clostridiales bacterium]
MKKNIGFFGFGNIGKGVYKIIQGNKESIYHKEKVDLKIKRILVRDKNKNRDINFRSDILTEDYKDIILDDDISIVIEVMGGIEPARTMILAALNNKKTVVTANKEVIAKHWDEFDNAARSNNVGLYFEASVAGGIPIIKVIGESMQANEITNILGIINGTTNYVLTKMSDDRIKFDDALEGAKRLGYSEPDPSADISGLDVMYKLSILSSMGFHSRVPLKNIYREGISHITLDDIIYGKELGYEIKLLAISKKYENKIETRVHPTFIPADHPLASVKDSFNAIFIKGSAVGELMLYGRGAGDMPTGSAVVSDVLSACKQSDNHRYQTFHENVKLNDNIEFNDNWETEFFVRLTVKDKSGVLSKIAGVFAVYGVSIASLIQKDKIGKCAPLIFVTHKTKEKSIEKAIVDIKLIDDVIKVENVIRVER